MSQTNLYAVLFLLVLGMMAACGPSGPPQTKDAVESSAAGDVQRYDLRGKIVQLEPENKAAVIEHEEIKGWMDAMTMRFPVKEQADWDKLTVGAQIEATVFVTGDGFHIGEVKVVEGEAPAAAEQP
jgi:Cu/Ag efflux protein CusF